MSPWDTKAKGDDAMLLDHTAKVLVAVPQKRQIITGLLGNAVAVPSWLVEEDYFTSAEVEQMHCDFCDWREGNDKLTAELPNVPAEKTAHLDTRGIVRPGTTVSQGMILVGKLSPRSEDNLTPEEKMLHAIFGRAEEETWVNNSLVYRRQDEGVVTRAQLLSETRMSCPEHGDIRPTPDKKCPYCESTLAGEIHRDNVSGHACMQVVIEIQIRRSLRLGDILEMPNESLCTVSHIVDSSPRAGGQDIAILFAKGSEAIPASHLHRSGMVRLPGKKGAGKCLMDVMRVKKVPLFAEEKCSARSTGQYSFITQLPLGSDPDHPAPRVRRTVVQELLRYGYRENVRELLGLKADAVATRSDVYGSLVSARKSLNCAASTPETTHRLEALLMAMAVPACVSDLKVSCTHDQTSIESSRQLLLCCASAKDVRKVSFGHVTSAETIDNRTMQPMNNGLYCQKIFGPVKDWECACGKYRGMKYKGMTCERCGVKIEHSRVRRRRFGIIELPTPVVHPLFQTVIKERLELDDQAFADIMHGLRKTRQQLPKKLREVDLDPDRVLLTVLPVLPAALRPMFKREDGSWAVSDLTGLYRRIVNRAQRLKKLIDLNAPEIIITNETRMLQESVTELFLNDRLERPVLGTSDHPLAGLCWHFERLLEEVFDKRVDYAARAIVIPDESVPAGHIGLPTLIARELFGPIAIRIIRSNELADTIRRARKMLQNELDTNDTVKASLAEALLDRHLLAVTGSGAAKSLQAVLVEGEVLRVSPEDAQDMNLRFNGERLTVHLPIAQAAIEELKAPQPLDDLSSAIEGLAVQKLVEYALGSDPVQLTEVDRIILGIR